MTAIMNYINGSIEELRHVQWPTQRQAVRLSLIVLVFIIVTSAIFSLVDTVLTEVLRLTLPS